MKKTVYDFKAAVVCAKQWYKPSELSLALKNAALRLAAINDNETDIIRDLQCAALDVCDFLDSIEEREVEQ